MTDALPMTTDTTKYTEEELYVLLRNKLTASGNGGSGEYAVLGHVRDEAGFGGKRTFDAVAVSLWPSRGLRIHIYEIKVSRSDWQRELKDPAKADDACRLADQFSIIAPSGLVRPGELPPTWGLLEVVGPEGKRSLRTKVQAPMLHEKDTRKLGVNRGFLVGMLRACPGVVPGGKVPAATKAELDDAYQRGFDAGQKQKKWERELAERDIRDSKDAIKNMTDALVAAGVESWNATPRRIVEHAQAVADALNGVKMDGRLEQARSALRAALKELGG